MRRATITKALVPLAVIVVAFGLVLAVRDATSSPNVAEIVRAAQEAQPDAPSVATARTIDGVGFPDWTRFGWDATGGSAATLEDDAHAATVVYRRDGQADAHGEQDDRIAVTIVGGGKNVDSLVPSREVERTMGTDKVPLELIGAGSLDKPSTMVPPAPQGACPESCNDDQLLARVMVVKRRRRTATVVLTGWPVSDRLFEELRLQAVRPRE